jgi:hypothetical protein
MANHFKNKHMALKSKLLLLFGIMLNSLGTNPLAAQQINGAKDYDLKVDFLSFFRLRLLENRSKTNRLRSLFLNKVQ